MSLVVAQDILRSAGLKSPALGGKPPKSILKNKGGSTARVKQRPPPLPLSSSRTNTTIIIVKSPILPKSPLAKSPLALSSLAIRSPHVHFPPSPILTATFATHSPNSYDRGAIDVSPNVLEIPGRGDRMYSPSSGRIVEVEEPSDCDSPTVITAKQVSFQEEEVEEDGDESDSKLVLGYSLHSPVKLSKALGAFPRSPYPTASFGATDLTAVIDPKRSNTISEPDSGRRSKNRKAPPPVLQLGAGRPATPRLVQSPLAINTYGPATTLNHEFWQAMCLSEDQEHDTVEFDVPNFAFATKSGELWSPGITARTKKGGKSFEDELQLMKSPNPVDRFSGFPSFTAVLTMEGKDSMELVTYPEPEAKDKK